MSLLWTVYVLIEERGPSTRDDRKPRQSDRLIGDGANEESAWRNTLSRMRIADEEEAAS